MTDYIKIVLEIILLALWLLGIIFMIRATLSLRRERLDIERRNSHNAQ